jgi:hypothetical protein
MIALKNQEWIHSRYRMRKAPMFLHCCHCRWCQRETGTAFALNGLVEAQEVTLLRRISIFSPPRNNPG